MELEAITRRINDLRRELARVEELCSKVGQTSPEACFYFDGRRNSYLEAIEVFESLYGEFLVTSKRVA